MKRFSFRSFDTRPSASLARRRRSAFTLVELLVVITIIGLLMALIFPAFGNFIAAANRTRCDNNIRELGKIVGIIESNKKYYPGYAYLERFRTDAGSAAKVQEVSWHVALLEHINEANFKALTKGQVPQPPEVKGYQCPAASSTNQMAAFNYVANCGMKDASGTSSGGFMDFRETAVFHRHIADQSQGGGAGSSKIVRFRSTDIKDGADRTILFSENLQTFPYWTQGQPVKEENVGIVFFDDKGGGATPMPVSKMINVQRDDAIGAPSYDYARPSSQHPDGVMVGWCGGGSYFLNDRVDYFDVYCKLMTPNGEFAKDPSTTQLLSKRLRTPLVETQMTNPQ